MPRIVVYLALLALLCMSQIICLLPATAEQSQNAEGESTRAAPAFSNESSKTERKSTSESTDSTPGEDSVTQSEEDSVNSRQAKPIATGQQKYVGNSFSLKFHRRACPFARVMRKSRRVSFPHRRAAIDAGQRPCKYCLPPWWLKVEAKLLNPELQPGSEKHATQQTK